ncbi:DUF5615 family PIN-like protein [Candidatus Peregrinibacteria bacterium]|jgi:predicted nuclease of predicted toxin-antitoxin system|nr:DUF5615 family PIN-like protein [Candidatus Peregrinibacteria bacterium]
MKKLLLDECMPKKLCNYFPEHEVKTVGQMGWKGKKNGDLLSKAEGEFDIMITVDKNMRYQQNFIKHEISLIILDVLHIQLNSIIALVEDTKEAIEKIQVHEIITISKK